MSSPKLLTGFLLLFIFSFSILAQSNDKILLVKYKNHEKCKRLEIRKDTVIEGSWDFFCGFFGIVDDFSEYFHNINVFYAQANLDITKETKFIFWDYGYIVAVNKLPFNYQDISIVRMLSDSVFVVKQNNKIQKVMAYNSINDSTLHRYRDSTQIEHRWNIYTIENLGLMNKSQIYTNEKIPFDKAYEFIKEQEKKELFSRVAGGYKSIKEHFYSSIPDTFTWKGEVRVWVKIDPKGKIKLLEIQSGPEEPYQEIIVNAIRSIPYLPTRGNADFDFHFLFKI